MSLDASIYVQSRLGKLELLRLISEKFGGQLENDTITTSQMNIYVDKNEQYNQEKIKEFPSGFLYFRYILDIYESNVVDDRIFIGLVSQVLEFFWSIDTPSVAACDFEEQLVNNGGYKNELLPWPKDT